MEQPDRKDQVMAGLRERLSRLGQASQPINESLDFQTCYRASWTRPAPSPPHATASCPCRTTPAQDLIKTGEEMPARWGAVARYCQERQSWRSTSVDGYNQRQLGSRGA